MMFPARAIVERIKKEYPKGCRVELIHMDDPYRTMPIGLKGTVSCVDDTGTIHVDWGQRLPPWCGVRRRQLQEGQP